MKNSLLTLLLLISHCFYAQSNKETIHFTINGIEAKETFKMQKTQLKDAVIGFKSNDKNGNETNKVISFTIKIPGSPAEIVKGNTIDNRIYQKILKLVSGDRITFFDIKTNTVYDPSKERPIITMMPVVIDIL